VIQKPLKYAGIGPRRTPLDVCEQIVSVSRQLCEQGWVVRSGHAQGADQAWAVGHTPDKREIYLPWARFNLPGGLPQGFAVSPVTPQLEAVARIAHPAWDRLNQGGQKLMMRNVSIILGHELDDPVQFVAYWSEQRKVQGGTGNAVNLASLNGIPSFNIAFEDDQLAMSDFVDSLPQGAA
jgi:hypothetical protein